MKSDKYCMYLRKSRKDIGQDETEVLARHEKILSEYAERIGVSIERIYSEGVRSGDSIADRPVMQQLVEDVDSGMWTGVFVTEFSRLARGNVRDQGEVLEAFGLSHTLIITPDKTYDLADENDETFSELGLMMARQEYKAIRRRMQAGRVRSAYDGRFQGSVAPYGYDKVRIEQYQKACTLTINEGEASVVHMIFDWYTVEHIGISAIATRLNSMQVPTRKGGVWVGTTIKSIITNPVYIGKIAWNRRKVVKSRENGAIKRMRPRADESVWIIAEGLHSALISTEQYDEAQKILADHRARCVRKKSGYEIKNPFAGLAVCGVCGRKMVRKPYSSGAQPSLICTCAACTNRSAILSNVEKRLLESLSSWARNYDAKVKSGSIDCDELELIDAAMKLTTSEVEQIEEQTSRLQDLLEQGVYDIGTYMKRQQILRDRRKAATDKVCALEKQRSLFTQQEADLSIIPKIENLVSIYPSLETAEQKNKLLREVLIKFEFVRSEAGNWVDPFNFTITLYPRV